MNNSPDLLVTSRPGTYVGDVAALTLASRNFDRRIVGFVFNGMTVMAEPNDTVAMLVGRYQDKVEEEERVTRRRSAAAERRKEAGP